MTFDLFTYAKKIFSVNAKNKKSARRTEMRTQ